MTSGSTGSTNGNRLQFTKRAIEKLDLPTERDRAYVYDEKTPGLALCITRAGRRTFYVYRKVHGRPQRIKLGRFGELTVEQARNKAVEIMGGIATGDDPQARRRKQRREPTLGQVFDHYLQQHAKPTKRSWREDKRQWETYLKRWRSRRLSSIDKADVLARHREIGKSAPVAANRVLALLSKLYNHATEYHGYDRLPPTRGVQRFSETSRERFLRADELPAFWKALEADESERVRDFIKLALFTGQRRGNVQRMRWADLDLKRRSWQIPDTKSGRPYLVPLPDHAIEVLRRREAGADGEYVLPGRRIGEPLTDPMRPFNRIVQAAGIEHLRLHDLRRTLGSWMAASGASEWVIARVLGHARGGVTGIYARVDLEPVRAAMEDACNAITAAAAEKPDRAGVLARIGGGQ